MPWVQVHPLLEKPVPDEVIVSRIDRHRRMADLLVESAPPPAPLPASRERHERGRALFAASCASCHGEYVQEEKAGRLATRIESYEEKLVPVAEIGTDPAYDASQDAEFTKKIAETPVGRLYQESRSENAYVARPLLGLRLRFPYLHDASVPSLRALLEEPAKRPRTFLVGADAPLDSGACGYGTGEAKGPRVRERDTSLDGNRATGHDYGTQLSPAEKDALVEYLKSL